MHGVEAARAAGMRVVGFTGGSHTYLSHADKLTDAGAETVLSRMVMLPGPGDGTRRMVGCAGVRPWLSPDVCEGFERVRKVTHPVRHVIRSC